MTGETQIFLEIPASVEKLRVGEWSMRVQRRSADDGPQEGELGAFERGREDGALQSQCKNTCAVWPGKAKLAAVGMVK